jgi:hypothetical protein
MKPYDKPALSYREQVELMRSRGLQVRDPSEAAAFLSRVSYYRISTYFLPFQTERDRFAPGIQSHILLLICGEKVMLDGDLASLYEVEAKVVVQAVKRNIERFPSHFMVQSTKEEFDNLKSQTVTSSRGGRSYPPYALTEQGVAMLSSVLRSDRGIRVNVEIMRALVRLRQVLASNAQLARKLAALEKKYDAQFKVVFDAIRQLMTPPEPKTKRRIGFATPEEGK